MAPIYHSKSFRQTQILDPTERRRHVSHVATEEGLKAAIVTSLFWLPPSAYLMFGTSPLSLRIQQRLHNGSVRAGFVMLPMLFAFLYESSEVAIMLGAHKPNSPLDPTAKAEPSRLPLYQRGANLVLDHPMRLLAVLSIPTIMTSFHLRQLEPSLTLSQRLMHTRVIAQFQIYVTMMGLMGLYSYMGYHGRFEDEERK